MISNSIDRNEVNMSNFIRNLIDSLHLNDDDDDDEDYEEYFAQANAREQKRAIRKEKKAEQEASRPSKSYYNDDTDEIGIPRTNSASYNDTKKDRAPRAEKPSGKVVPFRGSTMNLTGIRVMKPTSFEDSQDICDVLLSGKATIINLEGFDVDLAQRVMDFISGAVYAANGRLHQISGYIFIISPEDADVSGDYHDIIKQNGFGAPTINRDNR